MFLFDYDRTVEDGDFLDMKLENGCGGGTASEIDGDFTINTKVLLAEVDAWAVREIDLK